MATRNFRYEANVMYVECHLLDNIYRNRHVCGNRRAYGRVSSKGLGMSMFYVLTGRERRTCT
jgi:hypothetical protein